VGQGYGGGGGTQEGHPSHPQLGGQGLDVVLQVPLHVRQVFSDGYHGRKHRHKARDEPAQQDTGFRPWGEASTQGARKAQEKLDAMESVPVMMSLQCDMVWTQLSCCFTRRRRVVTRRLASCWGGGVSPKPFSG